MTARLPSLRDDKIRASGTDRPRFSNAGCCNSHTDAQRMGSLNECQRRNTEMKR